MRVSFLMIALAGIGASVAMGLVSRPPSYTGIPVVLFLLCMVVLYGVTLVRSHGYWEQWPGLLEAPPMARTVLIVVIQAGVLLVFVAVVAAMIMWRSWEIAPLLVASLVLNVLGFVQIWRERQESPPPSPGPVLIGWPEHTPPAQGWVPVRLLLAAQVVPAPFPPGFRLHLDGVPIALPRPRGTFVLGVPAGPHRLQAVVGAQAGSPLDFVAEPGKPVHLVLARRAGGLAWWPSAYELTRVSSDGHQWGNSGTQVWEPYR